MPYGLPLDELTPDMRVATAVAPFVIAMLLRLLLGRTQFTRWTIMIGTMWFAINVLLAPYSAGVRQDLGRPRESIPLIVVFPMRGRPHPLGNWLQ